METAPISSDAAVYGICTECKVPFTPEHFPGSPKRFKKMCPKCDAELLKKRDEDRKKAEADEKRAEMEKKWFAICPPIFRSIVKAKLPRPEKLDDVLKWQLSPKGLMLHGKTGLGKSRCAWALIHREFWSGKKVSVLDSMAGLRYAALYSRGAENVEEWIDRMIGRDIIFMDDIFKNKLTDSFEGTIFTLIDQRIQYQKPIIVTSNDTGDTLKARMSEDRAEPLLRRLRECCEAIAF
jgi:DNA replication protein DnaC